MAVQRRKIPDRESDSTVLAVKNLDAAIPGYPDLLIIAVRPRKNRATHVGLIYVRQGILAEKRQSVSLEIF